MTILTAASVATSPTATEGDTKDFLTNLRTVIAEFLGTDTTNKSAALATLGAALNGSVAKSANYTVVAADRGKVINASGTITINIAAAATLGDGFVFAVRNVGSGAVTIDPNLTEQINGALTVIVSAGDFLLIYCDGTGFSTAGGASAPAGEVAFFAMSTPPAGWLKADGSVVSRTTYARLFLAIGTTFGAGDGSTTFKLPDLRGEFLRGLDDGRGVDAGRALGSAQGSQNLAHTHTVPGAATHTGITGAVTDLSHTGTAISTASSGGAEARPRNIALLACIKF